jgi:hypothetical protein
MRTLRVALVGTVLSLIVGVLPLGMAAQTDGDDLPAETAAVGDLVYATGLAPDAQAELNLLLFHPVTGSEDAPMVIDVGGWAVDDPPALAERGVSVFSVLYPDRWPEVERDADPTALRSMAEAVACAVRFARGSEYGSETAPLVLVGFSRQGGLATHVALAGEDFDRVWDEYTESGSAPPAQYDCTVGEGSTRVDGLVGIAGTYERYVGHEGRYGRDWLQEREPDLWEMLWGTVGLHPELRVRLLHGDSDTLVPLEVSAGLETVLKEAGYDVDLIEFDGGHGAPHDLVIETVMDLVE